MTKRDDQGQISALGVRGAVPGEVVAAAHGRSPQLPGPEVTMGYANPHVANSLFLIRVLRQRLTGWEPGPVPMQERLK